MKNYLNFFLFILIPAFSISQEIDNSLLWEIKSPQINKSSFLYGTIHMVKKEDFKLKEKVKRSFNSCTKLALEVDLNMSLKTKMDVAMSTLLPNNKSIDEFMSKDEFMKLKAYAVDSIGISEKKFNKYKRLKPFYLSSILIKESLGKIKSYDEEFHKMSSKNNMSEIGLESIKSQLKIIDQTSIQDQVKMLLEGIENQEASSFDQMVKAYNEEDIKTLYNIIKSESTDIEGFQYNFIEKRNQNWISVIEKTINTEPTFIAVGAGHLYGEKGVINLLKKQGYDVNPVFK